MHNEPKIMIVNVLSHKFAFGVYDYYLSYNY